MPTKLTHLGLSVEDHVTVDLEINGVHVLVEVHNDVTVTALNASVKVAEQLSYSNGAQSVRLNIRPTLHAPDAAQAAVESDGN